MRVTIEKVSQGAKGIWTSHIDPQHLLRLANPIRQGGRINIVLVSRPSFDDRNHSLKFDLDSAILLNLGNTSEAVLIDSREGEVRQLSPDLQSISRKLPSGDSHFLEELKKLSVSQKEVGEQLLTEVRRSFLVSLSSIQNLGNLLNHRIISGWCGFNHVPNHCGLSFTVCLTNTVLWILLN